MIKYRVLYASGKKQTYELDNMELFDAYLKWSSGGGTKKASHYSYVSADGKTNLVINLQHVSSITAEVKAPKAHPKVV